MRTRLAGVRLLAVRGWRLGVLVVLGCGAGGHAHRYPSGAL